MQRVEDKAMDSLAVTEAHFGLTRVYVDVDQRGIQLQEQHERRVAVMVQHILVGLADGMRNQLVTHETAVDVDILRIPGVT